MNRKPKNVSRNCPQKSTRDNPALAAATRVASDRSEAIHDRVRACSLLAEAGCRDAVPLLIRISETESDQKLIRAACSALAWIGSRRAVRPLMRLVRQAKSIAAKEAAIRSLGELHDKRAQSLLVSVLRSKDNLESTRAVAAEALGSLFGAKHAESELIRVLSDPSTEVRYCAVCGLAAMRAVRAVPEIEKLSRDQSELEGFGTIAALVHEVLPVLTTAPEVRLVTRSAQRIAGEHG